MIPTAETIGEVVRDDIVPSRTYALDLERKRIGGEVDGLDAMRQAVYKILQTERFAFPVYSWNYGAELADVFGEPISYACPELERRIREALTADERVTGVEGFAFSFPSRSRVLLSFTVRTIFGDVETSKEVQI